MFPQGQWSFYYVAFRDPTFFNSIQVKLSPLGEENLCKDDPRDWITPDNYLMSKVLADIIVRTVSPLVSFIADLVGLLRGSSSGEIIQGDFCGM